MSNTNGSSVDKPQMEPEAWVVEGCSSPLHFWQQCQQPAPLPGPAMVVSHPAGGGEVLVIRGFNNLLHYLDWFDAVGVAGDSGAQRNNPPVVE